MKLHIYSFGYQVSGIPQDPHGNHGGFVFDCRCLPNPGRQAQYQSLTGFDSEVQNYLLDQPEVEDFFQGALHLIQLAIQSYQKQGYRNLMVSFGCTGGRHRSVYQANRLYHLLSKETNLEVLLTHTEESHW